MRNKYKILIIVLFGISLISNVMLFKENQKYKNITNNYVYNSLVTVFINAQILDTEFKETLNTKQIDNEEMNKINSDYEKMYISLLNLRDLSIKITDKNRNRLGTFQPYAVLMSDLNRFSVNIKKTNSNTKMKLLRDDIKFINKVKLLMDSIEEIHSEYSYTKDDMNYIRTDKWVNIVQKLSGLDYLNY